MKAVFPGKPQAKLHAVSTCDWNGRRLVTYISGSSLLVLGGPNDLLQTISHGDGEALTAVANHSVSGKIATCTATTVYLYKPFGQDEGAIEWSLQHTYTTKRGDSSITCLSWGASEELLVGGAFLTLLSTDQRPRESWSRSLANEIKYAALCPDGNIIATTAWHDKLVKIWKRSWFGEDDERFDISYLPHPAVVTGMRWHTRQDPDHHTEAILYTTCADQKLRVWAHTDAHDVQTLQLWAEIDMIPCLDSMSDRRYVIVVDNWEFEAMVENAAQQHGEDEVSKGAVKSLTEIAYRNPDICIILDDRGNMSAWGLERVGSKARPAEDFFNIAYGGKLDIRFVQDTDAEEDFLVAHSFRGNGSSHDLNLLLNFFDGRLEWMSCSIGRVFDQSTHSSNFRLDATLTGHADLVDKIIKSDTDSAIISLSSNGEIIQWKHNDRDSASVLIRSSLARVTESVSHLCFVRGGSQAVLLCQDSLSIWSFEHHVAREQYTLGGISFDDVLGLFQLSQQNAVGSENIYMALLTSSGKGVIWEISHTSDGPPSSIQEFSTFQVDLAEGPLKLSILPQQQNGTLQPPAIVASRSGLLTSMNFILDVQDKRIECFQISQVMTNFENPSIVTLGANYKVAVVDSNQSKLTIWDSRDGQIEFTETFESHENIHLVKWLTDTYGKSVFVVGLPHKVIVYGLRRYDFLGNKPAWSRLRLLDVSLVSNLYVADCAWLDNGDLLVAAGNQMFLYGNEMEIPRAIVDDLLLPPKATPEQRLTDVVAGYCSELPVYHPALLMHCMAAGKLDLVHRILLTLHKSLKFYTEGDDLKSDLGLNSDNIGDVRNSIGERDGNSSSFDSDLEETFTMIEETAVALNDKLSETRLPFLTSEEQSSLSNIIEAVGFTEKHQRSADKLGVQYLSSLRKRGNRLNGTDAPPRPLSWREIVWAFHSNTQDILSDLTSQQYQGKMLWTDARDCGIFMWMTDITALRTQFEVIARNEYSKTDERNPVDCSLHYFALKKKAVLVGLWRMAHGNREQGATQRLLANNFDEPKWKTTALKNAYALLGRRRFEYAAAFFLLADHLKDAVNVLATQLGDIQLAIAVARVYEGDDGPVVKFLIEDKILPMALQDGNIWLAHWAFSMLKRMDAAMRCLITPLTPLIPHTSKTPPPQSSRSFLNTDPALLSLYTTLRDTPHPGFLGKYPSAAVEPAEEWNAVVKTARLYERAGCGGLALQAVRAHTFPPFAVPARKSNESHTAISSTKPTSKSILDAYDNHDSDGSSANDTDTEVDANTSVKRDGDEAGEQAGNGEERDEPLVEKAADMKMGLLDAGVKRKVVVEEPSAASIFDSFDF